MNKNIFLERAKVEKIVNQNFILAMILVAAMTLVCIVFGVALTDLEGELDSTKSNISTTLEGGEVGDERGME